MVFYRQSAVLFHDIMINQTKKLYGFSQLTSISFEDEL